MTLTFYANSTIRYAIAKQWDDENTFVIYGYSIEKKRIIDRIVRGDGIRAFIDHTTYEFVELMFLLRFCVHRIDIYNVYEGNRAEVEELLFLDSL